VDKQDVLNELLSHNAIKQVGCLFVRSVSAARAKDWQDLLISDNKQFSTASVWVGMCLCDEGGAFLFTKEDLSELDNASLPALTPLLNAAMEVNGGTEAQLEKKPDMTVGSGSITH
jgi:hypothetical protein